MSAFVEVKSDFLRAAAQAGWTSPSEVPMPWQDSIPPQVLRRWLRQQDGVVIIDPSQPQRLVNHFKLGADPEFVFLTGSAEARLDASRLGFKAAQAWGADNNGRLCEIRPCPSRHALAVTTSIWATLNWMAKFAPTTLSLVWRSGAWVAGDGVGGHVHFGRKRPSWPREMQALDTLAFWLQHVNIFNQAEWRERIRRTRGRGNYGQLGDRRPQVHGWEYRTIPGWLDSPWLAFCILTLSKLAVFDPEFLPQLTPDADTQSAATVRAKLRGLLAYFKGRDDDAALAYQIFVRIGWPHFDTTDFKQRWGIFGNDKDQTPPPAYTIPNVVPPTPQLIAELGRALTEGRIPEWPECKPSWTPATLPDGYLQVLQETETFHHPGVGELVRDLVIHNHTGRPRFSASANSCCEVSENIVPRPSDLWLKKMQRKFPTLRLSTYSPERRESTIYIPGSVVSDAEARRQLVDFLTDGWAPIWFASKVKENSYPEWLSARKVEKVASPKPRRPASSVLWPPPVSKTPAKTFSSTILTWRTVEHQRPPSPGRLTIQPVVDGGRNVVDGNTDRWLIRNPESNRWEFDAGLEDDPNA